MKRRKLLLWWTVLQAGTSLFAFLTLLLLTTTTTTSQIVDAAIVPPPWSDPEKNPCASLVGGWQLLYWPPLKKCFKIFTIGFPCPETMELSPAATSGRVKGGRNAPAAECRCPPGTALSGATNRCHKIFERGPCDTGQYFGPMPELSTTTSKQRSTGNRWGNCKTPRSCPADMIFWPRDGRCYTKFTKGPCIKGKLLVLNEDDLGECKCDSDGDLRAYFYDAEESCHEHYTKGPCPTPGHLFLPGGRCDCQQHLPHYHAEHQMCFELNSPGPCPPGHIFSIADHFTLSGTINALDSSSSSRQSRAQCHCKDGYVPWADGFCYRLYTRGPCGPNEFLLNATSCVRNFCGKSRLYFPDQKSCYRIGSQGPCALHQVVVFDFTTRPSIDGISYNGMCGCAGVIQNLDQQCSSSQTSDEADATQRVVTAAVGKSRPCEATPGMVELNGSCHKLYSRGPCGPGQWLEALKVTSTTQLLSSNKAKCVCRPGYTRDENAELRLTEQRCNAPSVGLARYLTQYQQRQNAKLPAPPSPSSALYKFPNFSF